MESPFRLNGIPTRCALGVQGRIRECVARLRQIGDEGRPCWLTDPARRFPHVEEALQKLTRCGLA